jgi:hypothetical protein
MNRAESRQFYLSARKRVRRGVRQTRRSPLHPREATTLGVIATAEVGLVVQNRVQ